MSIDPVEPSRTEVYLARNLDDLVASTIFMLRLSDADDAPWAHVKHTVTGNSSGVECITVVYLHERVERLLNFDDPVEVGFD